MARKNWQECLFKKIHKQNSTVIPKQIVVQGSDKVAKMEIEKPIVIDLYEEGFTVNGGDLLLYRVKLNEAFFKDIYDGYFPIEFKHTYPDGVFLDVIDHRNENNDNELFKGHGRHLIESSRRGKRAKLPEPLQLAITDNKNCLLIY